MLRIGCLLTATGLAASLLFTVSADAALTANASSADIKITGATPNREVAVCRFAEAYQAPLDWFVKQATVKTADANGTLTVQADQPTIRSIWLVVDFATNTYVIASPALRAWRLMQEPPVAEPETPSVAVIDTIADVFIVHAPLGIWTGEGVDGRAGDDDGVVNGKVTFKLRNLTPIESTPPGPAVLVPGDIIFTVQPAWMSYQVLQIPKGNGNGH